MPFDVRKYMTLHVHKKENPSHTRQPRKSHARTPSRTLHTPPPLTGIPRFLPGEVPRLGLDRAGSMGFVVLIFFYYLEIVSRVALLPFFWRSEGPRDYPGLALKYFPPRLDPPTKPTPE